MPEPQEQTPEERRFERIEAAHEFLTGIVAGIGVAQTKTEEAQLRTQYALTEAVEAMEREHKRLLIAQVVMYDAQTKAEERIVKLADIEVKRAVEHDDLKDKLHLLYDVVDNWIREHGGGAKNGNPAPETPPSA